jgi:hypothetical protein
VKEDPGVSSKPEPQPEAGQDRAGAERPETAQEAQYRVERAMAEAAAATRSPYGNLLRPPSTSGEVIKP